MTAVTAPSGVARVIGETRGKILIVDDAPTNVRLISRMLRDQGFERIHTTTEPHQALPLLEQHEPDVLLLDVVMPGLDGMQILRQISEHPRWSHTPVLVLTAESDPQTKRDCLELGATDFLAKPVDPIELVARVRNAVTAKQYRDRLKEHAEGLEREVQRRIQEIDRTRREVVHCLARAAEFRDNETGRHIQRVGRFSGIIADELGSPPQEVEDLELAAALHDVGKIGVPDAILLKPGKLTSEEFDLMKRHAALGRDIFEVMSSEEESTVRDHTTVGERILGDPYFNVLRLARVIAQTHHEKYDGSGYPMGLAGEDIPLPGRIVAVADVYDALSSKRPYKDPMPRQKCFEILEEGRGKHFDPAVLDAFFGRSEDIINAQLQLADPA